MSNFNNEMSGAIFKNKKRRNNNSPDYTGQCEIDGKEFWMSAWIKTPKQGGDKFMSLAFTEKDNPQNSSSAPSPAKAILDDFDDDIPF